MELERFTIRTSRMQRTVEVWQKGDGPDLVYLHGAGGLSVWTPDLDALAKSFRVTAPLHPGFGESDGVESIDTVLDSVLHTFDVIGDLGISDPIVMGHSFGGMLAAEMAAICPNDVSQLVLVCPLGFWDDDHPVLDFFTKKAEELAPLIFHDVKHPMAQAMMVEPAEDELVDLAVAYIKGLSAVGRLLWPIPDRGLNTRLDRIIAPTLILWGESDGLAPSFYAGEFRNGIPGAKLRLFRNASHMLLQEETAEATREIRRFLKAVESRPARVKSAPALPKRTSTKKKPPTGSSKKIDKPPTPARKSAGKTPSRASKNGSRKTPSKKSRPKKAAKKPASKKKTARA